MRTSFIYSETTLPSKSTPVLFSSPDWFSTFPCVIFKALNFIFLTKRDKIPYLVIHQLIPVRLQKGKSSNESPLFLCLSFPLERYFFKSSGPWNDQWSAGFHLFAIRSFQDPGNSFLIRDGFTGGQSKPVREPPINPSIS